MEEQLETKIITISIGDHVMLKGLISNSDLNGRNGVVTALNGERLRACVMVEGQSEPVMVKFVNLEIDGSFEELSNAQFKRREVAAAAAAAEGLAWDAPVVSAVCARPHCQVTLCRFKCSRCALVAYCNVECQHQDWSRHKVGCKTKKQQSEESDELFMAVFMSRDLARVQNMIVAGVNVNFINNDGNSVLFSACCAPSGNGIAVAIVDVLLAAGAHVNFAHRLDNATPAFMASQQGHLQILRSLVRAGADVNVTKNDEWAESPLTVASQKGFVDIVDALLVGGARVDYIKSLSGISALHIAAHHGHHRVIRSLVRAGSDVNLAALNDEGSTALILVCNFGFVQCVDPLIEAGANVNFGRKKEGCTALFMAAQNGYTEILRKLIRANANVNQTTIGTSTHQACSPLLMASRNGHVQCVDSLIAAGADLNYRQPSNSNTPLMVASQLGFVDVVRSLLTAGADPRLGLPDGTTPLSLANRFKHHKIAAMLEAKAAELT